MRPSRFLSNPSHLTQQVQPLNDHEGATTIASLTPPDYPGSDRIRVLFQVDKQRFLRMSVEYLLTNQALLQDQVVAQLSRSLIPGSARERGNIRLSLIDINSPLSLHPNEFLC